MEMKVDLHQTQTPRDVRMDQKTNWNRVSNTLTPQISVPYAIINISRGINSLLPLKPLRKNLSDVLILPSTKLTTKTATGDTRENLLFLKNSIRHSLPKTQWALRKCLW
jgi:hypothetical protein